MAPVKPASLRGAGPKPPSSGERGKPVSGLFAHIEKRFPGIEEELGVSSAALRAGELVRGMRKARGWTQTQLADMLGWDQVRISNIERGEGTRGPTFDVLQKIANACDYDLRFTPREQTASEAKAVYGEPVPVYAGLFTGITNKINAFVENIDEHAAVRAEIVEGVIEPETKPEPPGIPYIEVTGHGQRMVMMPVAVEPAPGEKTAEVEVKFYPNRLPGAS